MDAYKRGMILESKVEREMRVVRNVENKRESGELQWQQLQVQ